MLKKSSLILFITLLTLTQTIAQVGMARFGKNRVQYKNFNWRYYSSENFDAYFYDGGNDIARIGIEYLEEEFDRITDMLGYAPYSKIKVFIFNSPIDLKQSNIGVNEKTFTVGGQTDFVKPIFEVAFPGTLEQYKEDLVFQATKLLIKDMMFGGSIADMFQNSYLMSLPEWFVNGAAAYIARGWDVEMDNFIRDMVKEKPVKKPNKHKEREAELLGQAIWNFIAEKYGRTYISNVLNLTRIIRNEERSISGTLGVPYKIFLNEFNEYYMSQASFVYENYTELDASNALVINNRDLVINSVKLSPEGNYLAYSEINRGRYKVHLINLNKKNKDKIILRGGYKVINQQIDYTMPLLSWQSEGTLGIIHTRYGNTFLTMYTATSGKKRRKRLNRINQVQGFDIVKDGNLAVLSADNKGNNDLYLISLRRNSIKRITGDFYDDIDPRFVPETSSIVFSSNRTTDTIYNGKTDLEKISGNYNLFIYNIDSTRNRVFRVTNNLSRNSQPIAPNEHEIYYISDQQGVANIQKYELKTGINKQVSSFAKNIKDWDITYDKEKLAYVSLLQESEAVFLENNPELNENKFTIQTKRRQLINAKFVAKRLQERRKNEIQKEASGAPVKETPEKEDAVPGQDAQPSLLDAFKREAPTGDGVFNTDEYTFSNEIKEEGQIIAQEPEIKQPDGDGTFVDTDNFVFETEAEPETQENKYSFLSAYSRLRESNDITGPNDYQTQFTANNVVTSFEIDPLIGFGLRLETQMNDLLEDHRFYGGILAATDLKSGEVYGEYQYLKHTIDYGGRYYRRTIFRDIRESQFQHKYTLNQFELSASIPLSVTTRFTVTPIYAYTQFFNLDPNAYLVNNSNFVNDQKDDYLGAKLELVFDNSVARDLNVIQGTRGRISFLHYEGVSNGEKTFSNLTFDIRNYQKIHRELTLATRLYYGMYLGPNQQNYLLGGLDNWLFNETNQTGDNDPLRTMPQTPNTNILFLQYLTPLRGFDYNALNGSNALLINAELRFPVIKYFYRGPIASNFFRNLQFVGFFDVGSAWTGASPFDEENSINTETLKFGDSPFEAKIKNFKNPWLSSYGFGMRTVLLGYYVKLDVAYPVEDYERGKARFFVSLGYDF
ncbi:MAG TPA: translocation protein TolB [Cytophagales bacterium]|jgi:Tol biopolymer transport system component|nr:translocation protein TolB [Cytophagales bacterium]